MEDQESRKKQKLSEIESSSIESSPLPYYIPEEIVRRILPELPVKSLLRFKCVSKQWNIWISQTRIQRKRLLLTTTNSLTQRTIDQTGLVEHAYIPFDKMSKGRSLRRKILGSCNGLLLLSVGQDLYLHNLSTRRFRKILSTADLNDGARSIVGELCLGGLCFDSYNNDYLAVLAVTRSRRVSGFDNQCNLVIVGSARTKSWRKIYLRYQVFSTGQGTVLNNLLHCCALYDGNRNSPSEHIVYFDPKTYEFVKLPMPEPKSGEESSIASLGVLGGCLCMTRRRKVDGPGCEVEVLSMREYGVKESWTLLFKFEGLDCFRGLVPYFYTRSKQEVLMKVLMSGKDYIVRYDTKRKVFTDLEIHRVFTTNTIQIVYEESLVEPPSYGHGDQKRYKWELQEEEEDGQGVGVMM